MKAAVSTGELEKLSYEELNKLAGELAIEDEEIKKVRHYFIEEFWRRTPEKTMRPENLRDGEMIGIRLGNKQILWAKVDGKIYALNNRCPHRGFPLHKGKLEGCTLTCAYHGGKFDVRSGSCLRHPTDTYRCETFQVELLDDGTVLCKSAQSKG